MLDEPTSGLDSTTALHLLQLLTELAAGGRSIASAWALWRVGRSAPAAPPVAQAHTCRSPSPPPPPPPATIHQPSSRLYQKLDKLMLLADGHVVYYGGAQAVLSWFAALGFDCPYGVNVADFLLDLAQGEVTARRPGGGGGKAAPPAPNGAGKAEEGEGGEGGKEEGDGALTGAPAVEALWASYEEFHK
jgi:hypothetical protein